EGEVRRVAVFVVGVGGGMWVGVRGREEVGGVKGVVGGGGVREVIVEGWRGMGVDETVRVVVGRVGLVVGGLAMGKRKF
ncbi:hypothetical protein, partial [Micrococcus luteus]|uniref:hypothetical protein n=1 Tax=Micrococcus luteus TaxID=1270 RepID=UPI00164365D0